MSTAVAPRRRRRWPIVLLAVVLALATLVVAGGVLAERAARDQVSRVASTTLASRLGVAPGKLSVTVGPGLLLPQLLAGRVDRVDVVADGLRVQGMTGSLDATLRGVAVSGSDARSLTGTVTVPVASLATLAAQAGGPKVDSIRGDRGELVAAASAAVFGLTVPVAVRLRPSVDAGAVVLTPTAVQVAGSTIDPGSLLSGPLAGTAAKYLTPIRVCVADRLPSGITLRSATVSGQNLVLGFTGSNVALRGGGTGSCG